MAILNKNINVVYKTRFSVFKKNRCDFVKELRRKSFELYKQKYEKDLESYRYNLFKSINRMGNQKNNRERESIPDYKKK